VVSKPARFWMKLWTTSKPSVLASSQLGEEDSNSPSLTLGSCTAATTAHMGFSLTSLCIGNRLLLMVEDG
jgi:hypothetical protein